MMEPSGGAVVGGARWLADSQNNVITDSAGNALDAGTIIDDWQVCRTGIGGATAGGLTQIQAAASRSSEAAAIAGGTIILQAIAMQSSTGGAVVGGTMGLPPQPTNLLHICYTVKVSRNQFLADNYRTTVRRRY